MNGNVKLKLVVGGGKPPIRGVPALLPTTASKPPRTHGQVYATIENTGAAPVTIKKGAAIGFTSGVIPGVSGYITVNGCPSSLRQVDTKYIIYDAPEDE